MISKWKTEDWILSALGLFGLIGSILFVDEFDNLRNLLTAFVAVPGLVVRFSARLAYPQILARYIKTARCFYSIMLVVFGWGTLNLLNALGDGQERVEVAAPIGASIGTVAHYRGPLGIIYRPRF